MSKRTGGAGWERGVEDRLDAIDLELQRDERRIILNADLLATLSAQLETLSKKMAKLETPHEGPSVSEWEEIRRQPKDRPMILRERDDAWERVRALERAALKVVQLMGPTPDKMTSLPRTVGTDIEIEHALRDLRSLLVPAVILNLGDDVTPEAFDEARRRWVERGWYQTELVDKP